LRQFWLQFTVIAMLLAACMVPGKSQQPDMRPINKLGPILWESSVDSIRAQTIVGRERGLVSTQIIISTNAWKDTVTKYVTFRAIDGRIVSTIYNRYDGKSQLVPTAACDPSGSVLVASQHTSWSPNSDSCWIRSYDTETGELLAERRLNAWVHAVSQALDRCLVEFRDPAIRGGKIALFKLSTFEIIDTLRQSNLGTIWYFDEQYRVLYSSRRGTVHEFDATTGSHQREFYFPYDGPVRRIRGTDTLFAVGYTPDVASTHARFGIIDMTNRKYHPLMDNLSPYWSTFVYLPNGTQLIPSLDGKKVYTSRMSGSVATHEVVAYSIEGGLERYCSNVDTPNLPGDDLSFVGNFDVESNVVIGARRFNTTTTHSIVPVTTSVEQTTSDDAPGVTCDGTTASLTGSSSWSIVSIHDMQGRQLAAPCHDMPCRSVNVLELSSGSYLCRTALGARNVSVIFSIVR
jgi:hypothetical protein